LICDEEIVFITELVIWWECNLNLKPADHKIGRPELSIRRSYQDASPIGLASRWRWFGEAVTYLKKKRAAHVNAMWAALEISL
jgi:hypothetical protein